MLMSGFDAVVLAMVAPNIRYTDSESPSGSALARWIVQAGVYRRRRDLVEQRNR